MLYISLILFASLEGISTLDIGTNNLTKVLALVMSNSKLLFSNISGSVTSCDGTSAISRTAHNLLDIVQRIR